MNRKKWRRRALALSACLFVLWWALGTSATLAWFSDEDIVRNEFRFAQFGVEVEYKNDIQTEFTEMLPTSEVFYDEALYEPGYTQVVYLKIDNTGTVDFNYKVAVTVVSSRIGTSVLGNPIYLPDYLRYGIIFAESEEELNEKVHERLDARNAAENVWGTLGTWSVVSPYTYEIEKKQDDPDYAHYAALIVYMPEEIGNAANHIGANPPEVELGVTVVAKQTNAPMD